MGASYRPGALSQGALLSSWAASRALDGRNDHMPERWSQYWKTCRALHRRLGRWVGASTIPLPSLPRGTSHVLHWKMRHQSLSQSTVAVGVMYHGTSGKDGEYLGTGRNRAPLLARLRRNRAEVHRTEWGEKNWSGSWNGRDEDMSRSKGVL